MTKAQISYKVDSKRRGKLDSLASELGISRTELLDYSVDFLNAFFPAVKGIYNLGYTSGKTNSSTLEDIQKNAEISAKILKHLADFNKKTEGKALKLVAE